MIEPIKHPLLFNNATVTIQMKCSISAPAVLVQHQQHLTHSYSPAKSIPAWAGCGWMAAGIK